MNVIILDTIPLRDRSDDIILLCRYFLKEFQNDVSPVKNIDLPVLELLEQYDWPGNIRELENCMRRAVAIGRKESVNLEDLPELIVDNRALGNSNQRGNEDFSLKTAEKKAIEKALKKSDGNRTAAAVLLDIGEATLYRKIKLYGLS